MVARAVVRDLYDRERAARVFSYMSMAQSLNPMLRPSRAATCTRPSAGARSSGCSPRSARLFVVLMAVGVPETNVRRDPTALQPGQMGRNLAVLLGDRSYLGYVLVNALMFGGQFAFISGSSFVLIGVLGVSPSAFGLASARWPSGS